MEEAIEKLIAYGKTSRGNIVEFAHNLRREPALRKWLPLESYLFPMFPVSNNEPLRFSTLVSSRSGDGYLSPPWGAIEWMWPEKRLCQLLDLRLNPEIEEIRKKIGNIQLPGKSKIDAAKKEAALFEKLQGLTKLTPEKNRFDDLAELYRDLIPDSLIDIYTKLYPTCNNWMGSLGNKKAFEPLQKEAAGGVSSSIRKIQPALEKSFVEMNGNMGIWFREGMEIAEACNCANSMAELEEAGRQLKFPGFRLAVVGDFSSGKSTFINTLLERDLLKAGPTPTTGAIISLVYGKHEFVQIEQNGRGARIPIDEFKFEGVISKDLKTEQTIPKVRFSIDNRWLNELGLEIFDTPGINDLHDSQAETVWKLLSQCDGVILVVSPPGTLSLSQKVVLGEEIIGRYVPSQMVLVSKMDTIPDREQDEFLLDVQNRVAEIDSDVPVLPLNKGGAVTENIHPIKERINAMVTAGQRKIWKSRQCAAAISATLKKINAQVTTKLEAFEMDSSNRQEERKKTEWALDEAKIIWDDFHTGVEQRREAICRDIKKNLALNADNIYRDMKFNLKMTPDPISWWKNALPHLLSKHVISVLNGFEDKFIETIAKDYEALRLNVQNKFGVLISTDAPSIAVKSQNELNLENNENLDDQRKTKLYTQLGAGAASVLGLTLLFPIAGPLAFIVPSAVMILAPHLLAKRTEEQREYLLDKLEYLIRDTLDRAGQSIEAGTRDFYDKLAADLHREGVAWLEAKANALSTDVEPEEVSVLKQQLEKSAQLQIEISEYLQ